jgi:hypothetical protein
MENNKLKPLIDFFSHHLTDQFEKNSKKYPRKLFALNGDIFFDNGVTIEGLDPLLMEEIYDNFQDGNYNFMHILSYFRSQSLEKLGI